VFHSLSSSFLFIYSFSSFLFRSIFPFLVSFICYLSFSLRLFVSLSRSHWLNIRINNCATRNRPARSSLYRWNFLLCCTNERYLIQM
jgi:hypothetical protein